MSFVRARDLPRPAGILVQQRLHARSIRVRAPSGRLPRVAASGAAPTAARTHRKESSAWSRNSRRWPTSRAAIRRRPVRQRARRLGQGHRPADLARRHGRVRQGAGRRQQVFEALVKEGSSLQKKTQGVAEEKIGEVTEQDDEHGRRSHRQGRPALGQARVDLRGAHRQGAGASSACRPPRTWRPLMERVDALERPGRRRGKAAAKATAGEEARAGQDRRQARAAQDRGLSRPSRRAVAKAERGRRGVLFSLDVGLRRSPVRGSALSRWRRKCAGSAPRRWRAAPARRWSSGWPAARCCRAASRTPARRSPRGDARVEVGHARGASRRTTARRTSRRACSTGSSRTAPSLQCTSCMQPSREVAARVEAEQRRHLRRPTAPGCPRPRSRLRSAGARSRSAGSRAPGRCTSSASTRIRPGSTRVSSRCRLCRARTPAASPKCLREQRREQADEAAGGGRAASRRRGSGSRGSPSSAPRATGWPSQLARQVLLVARRGRSRGSCPSGSAGSRPRGSAWSCARPRARRR